MEPDDASPAHDLSGRHTTEAPDPPAPDLASATISGAHEQEPFGASTPASDPVDAAPTAAMSVEDETTAPLEADEARLLGGVTPDAIATEADGPDAVTANQADASDTGSPDRRPGTAGQPDPARLGTDAPAAPGANGSAPDAPSVLPASPGQLVTAAANSVVRRVVPVVSVAAIAALIIRSVRRRSR